MSSMSSRIWLMLLAISYRTQAVRRQQGEAGRRPRQGATTHSNLDSQWSGAEGPQAFWPETFKTDAPTVSPAIATDFRRSPASRRGQESLVLLGPIDAGTNLLTQIMLRNFHAEMVRTCHPSKRGCRGVWKHSVDYDGIVARLEQFMGKDLSRTAVVAIVRSPIALVSSWAKDPWDMADCVRDSLRHVDQPCRARVGAAKPLDHIGIAGDLVPEMQFNNTMAVYNMYLRTYHELRASGRFQHVHLVRYEDLLLAPVNTTLGLARALGWREPETIFIANKAAKKQGYSSGRYNAMSRLSRRDYLQDVLPAGMDALCKHPPSPYIDEAFHGTPAVEEAQDIKIEPVGSYWADCDSWLKGELQLATRPVAERKSSV